MTTTYSQRLDEAPSRRGYRVPVDAVIDAIREANQTTTKSLTAPEHDFLLRASDLTEADLSPELAPPPATASTACHRPSG
jgi:hypothetical protein